MPVTATLVAVTMAGVFVPPRATRVDTPAIPTGVVWMQALAVGKVDASGRVSEASLVHGPGPIGPALTSAVQGWEFAPALDDTGPVASPVVVAAIIRPPSFPDIVGFGSTMEAASQLPEEVAAPVHVQAPPYPAMAVGDGVVVIEFVVDPEGDIRSLMVVTPSSGFDASAQEAARQWKFRPARRNGETVAATVMAVFGFVSPSVSVGDR
jgi:TonB family protein